MKTLIVILWVAFLCTICKSAEVTVTYSVTYKVDNKFKYKAIDYNGNVQVFTHKPRKMVIDSNPQIGFWYITEGEDYYLAWGGKKPRNWKTTLRRIRK